MEREGVVASTYERGRRFEDVAVAYLARRGWTVLARNVRFRRKEIDMVIRRGRTVAFVEVKGRNGDRFGHPLDAITPRKRAEIEGVARWWIARHGQEGEEYRFDAVAVQPGAGGRLRVEHLEDAWRAGGP